MHLTLTAALLAATLCTQVHAESTTLYSHDDWRVSLDLHDETGELSCSAYTFDGESMASIDVDATGFYSFNVIFTNTNLNARSGQRDTFVIFMDQLKWSLHDALFIGAGMDTMILFDLGYTPRHKEFVRDVMRHDAIYIYGSGRERLATFSLDGSSAAIQSLDECRKMLMNDF